MQGRKRSFVAGMNQAPGLARTASQMFFKQEKTHIPITKRKIFWVNLIIFLGYFVGAVIIVIFFFKTNAPINAYAVPFEKVTVSPTSWGTDNAGNPCPFGGCTKAPTIPPPATKAPTA